MRTGVYRCGFATPVGVAMPPLKATPVGAALPPLKAACDCS